MTENLYGIPLMTAELCIPEGVRLKTVERRLARIIRLFRKNSISRVIIPADFPFREQFRCFKEVDELELYRAVADVLALGWLELHGFAAGRSCVTLAGARLCPELENAARRLCKSVREICIEVPGLEGELFAADLQQCCGIPVTPRGARSDLTIEFGPTESTGQLRLWGDQPTLDGLQVRAEGIELTEELFLPFLTLLWEQGKVRREQLRICRGEKRRK